MMLKGKHRHKCGALDYVKPGPGLIQVPPFSVKSLGDWGPSLPAPEHREQHSDMQPVLQRCYGWPIASFSLLNLMKRFSMLSCFFAGFAPGAKLL